MKKFFHNNHIKLKSLIDTRVKHPKMDTIMNNLNKGWGYIHNCQSASNGRIWIIWEQQSYSVTLVEEDEQ